MRRRDREVTGLQNITAILDKCEILRIGLCLENKPYIVPMNFVYEVICEDINVYLHCASEGKKLDIIKKNNNVCFEADCSYKTLKAEEPCRWSAEYESVIGEGKVIILTDEIQKINALNIFMKRYGFEGKLQFNQQELSAVTILKILVTSITGKCKI